jgi:hypothetical protein
MSSMLDYHTPHLGGKGVSIHTGSMSAAFEQSAADMHQLGEGAA